MKNFDLENNKFENARATLMAAMQKGDDESQKEAFGKVIDAIQEDVKAMANAEIGRKATELAEASRDEQILMNRGHKRVLTTEERKYFNAVVEKGDFSKVAEMFPVTIVEDVLSKIETEHPILSKVDSRTISGFMKLIYAKPNAQLAFWGDICDDIRQLILGGFEVANLSVFKLSGFVVMCKGMLELGPQWLAEFIYRTLYEIMAASLEHAIVNGQGASQKQPIGMIKSLVGVVDGVYKDKTPLALTGELNAFSLLGVRGALAQAKMDNGPITILVNPVTYWNKLFTAYAFQTSDGRWMFNNFPTGEEVIMSYAVPEEKLIIGNMKNYFLGIASDVKITVYDQTLAIEDLDLYIAKFFGNGMPKDPNAFFVVDVAGATSPNPIKVPVLESETGSETPEA